MLPTAESVAAPLGGALLPQWLLFVSGAVLIGCPLALVLGLLASGLLLVYVSIVLAVLALPAMVVLIVGIVQRASRRT